MKCNSSRWLLLAALTYCSATWGQSKQQQNVLDASFLFGITNPSDWNVNGTWRSEGGAGLASMVGNSGGFSIISAVPIPSDFYDADMTLHLGTNGGTYVLYLDASAKALEGVSGSFYAFEVSNPTFSANSCVATGRLIEAESGVSKVLSEMQVPCDHDITYHAVSQKNGEVWVFANRALLLSAKSTTGLMGSPGVGGRQIPSGNEITNLQTRLLRARRPTFFIAQTITPVKAPHSLRVSFRGIDPSTTVGIAFYKVYRGSTLIAQVSKPEFIDKDLTPQTKYAYSIRGYDLYNQPTGLITFDAETSEEAKPQSTSQNALPNLLCGDACDDPTDPTPIGPPPPSPPAPGYYNVTFSCTNALLYRPVGKTWPLTEVNHSYIYQTLFDHVDEWGVAPYNQYQFIIIEGLPQYVNPLPPPTNFGWLQNHYDENLDDSSPSPVIPSAY